MIDTTVAGQCYRALLRNGRIVKTLLGEVAPQLGVSGSVVLSEEMLEPADQVLFFTGRRGGSIGRG